MASLPKGGERGRYRPDLEPALAALSRIADPGLEEQAAAWLTRFDHATGDDERLLELLAGVEAGNLDSRMALSEFAVNRSVKAGDWRGAEGWLDRYAEALERACPPEDPSEACAARREEWLASSGRVAAMTGRDPRTWEEALVAAAWTCQLGGHAHVGTSTGLGTWTGRWSWSGWDNPTALTSCLGSTETAPPPPAGTRVRLTLRGPGQRG